MKIAIAAALPHPRPHPHPHPHPLPLPLSLALALALALPLTTGCASTSTPTASHDAGASDALAPSSSAAAGALGDRCVPTQEDDARFLGFVENEVNLETHSPSCATGICLVNHFRGRASCPYGQSADGVAPSGAQPCTTPDTHAAVTGGFDPKEKAHVAPQCVDRTADKTVYCSCRCANADGRTDDGRAYCACGDGFTCAPLVSSIGSDPDNIAGSYCIKAGTAYDNSTACALGNCDPATRTCE